MELFNAEQFEYREGKYFTYNSTEHGYMFIARAKYGWRGLTKKRIAKLLITNNIAVDEYFQAVSKGGTSPVRFFKDRGIEHRTPRMIKADLEIEARYANHPRGVEV